MALIISSMAISSYYGEMKDPLISYLQSFISPYRVQRMEDVLARRTEYLTVVLEDLHYSQNSSAVIRHCDAFGIQNLHIIENTNRFKLKKHAMRGTLKWITLTQYNQSKNNTREAIDKLKSRGYRIVATAPGAEGFTPSDFDLKAGPCAVFFGNEKLGLSPEVLENCDARITIPMVGFVDSLNISASCAIILQQLGEKLRQSDLPWQLKTDRHKEIQLEWLSGSIKKIDRVMDSYQSGMY